MALPRPSFPAPSSLQAFPSTLQTMAQCQCGPQSLLALASASPLPSHIEQSPWARWELGGSLPLGAIHTHTTPSSGSPPEVLTRGPPAKYAVKAPALSQSRSQ